MKYISINLKQFAPLMFLLGALICSCERDVGDPVPGKSTLQDPYIASAKLWFEHWQQEKELSDYFKSSSSVGFDSTVVSSMLRTSGTPRWESARVGVDGVVEVPLELNRSVSFSANKESKDAELNASITRLLIYRDEDGFYDQAYMHIHGDADYLSRNGYTLENNHYKDVQPDFTGYVFYTSPEGSFINGWSYQSGKIEGVVSAIRPAVERQVEYPKTKTAPVCYSVLIYVYEQTCYYDYMWNFITCTPWGFIDVIEVTVCSNVGGGGGGIMNPADLCPVSLTVNPEGSGTAIGSGNYVIGSSPTISANPKSGYLFVNWSGDISSTASSLDIYVYFKMYITANFRPCYATNKANPLPKMALAPPIKSDGSLNIEGATFGNTRTYEDGTVKKHNGIDLAGAVGTPIYAQFDGTIAGTPVTEQPNRVTNSANKNYPSGYSGDINDAGNRVYINSIINGSSVSFGYWHLQAVTPLANNPRTGQPWAAGNPIYAGEVIGYIGVTGNANPNVPHVHLTNGANINPTTYLNATVTTTSTTITTPCD